jgi:hypothetical protein
MISRRRLLRCLQSLPFFLPLKALKKGKPLLSGKRELVKKLLKKSKNTAATRGTAMHSYLEYHIAGQGLLDLTESGVEAKRMAEVVVEKGLGDLDEIWGSECVLYYPELYAGQTDLCGVYQGRESIVDFQTK